MDRDAWWYCEFCGNHELANEFYGIGESEPCAVCSEGVARVMTCKDATALESEIAQGLRQRKSAYS